MTFLRFEETDENLNRPPPDSAVDVDVDVVDLRAQADASMPASNNNVKLYNISNF